MNGPWWNRLPLASIVLPVLVTTGCVGKIGRAVPMSAAPHDEAKDWSLMLEKVRDGADAYAQGGHRLVPPRKHRFLWVTVRLRNDAGRARSYNWDRCDLDLGDERVLPAFVDRAKVVNMMAKDVEELEPGEEIRRKLAFPYPKKQSPTRLTCGEISLALPAIKTR